MLGGHPFHSPEKEENTMKVIWDDQACCHSGNCVKTLPEVFKVENGQFLIQPKNASEQQVQQVVAACPAKALRIEAS